MDDELTISVYFWQTVGDYEYEHDGREHTGWARCVDGRTVDGRWPQFHQQTGAQRDYRVAFPDGRTHMRADELPLHWLGYMANDAANLGIESLEGRPGFVSEYQTVYAALTPGHQTTLERTPGDKPRFELRLPHGEAFGGRSTFEAVFPNFYS